MRRGHTQLLVRGSGRTLVATAALAPLMALAACTGASGPHLGAPSIGGGAAAAATLPQLTIAPATDSQASTATPTATDLEHLRPDSALSFAVQDGRLRAVDVYAPDGTAVAGSLADSTWQPEAALALATTYRVHAVLSDSKGGAVTHDSNVTTLTPTGSMKAYVAPIEGQTVGVGMPIMVTLTAPAKDRAAVERALTVVSSDHVEGAWRWLSDTRLHWRPAKYWPAGEKVTLNVRLAGLDAGNGVWGVQDRTIHFSVGASHISYVDAAAHTMRVTVNGATVRTLPVSTGRDKYPTQSGVHVVINKTQDKIMDSATVGIPRDSPDGYYEHVFWSTRISNSGEFVHAAPWSVGDQGRRNVSHGCVNVSTANAEWFYNLSRPGDVVEIVGTQRSYKFGPDWTDWTLPWSVWKQGSALS